MKDSITVRIKGGKKLNGEIPIVQNKNAILPALTAAVLTNNWMRYNQVPKSPDVLKILTALENMGATVRWNGTAVNICCKNINTFTVPNEYIHEIQAGYLFAGPLLARFKEAVIPLASGCRLGYRGYEDHAAYLKKLGVYFEIKDNAIHFKLDEKIKEERVKLEKETPLYELRSITYSTACVTPTENVLMLLAATSRFKTEISGIAQEPHVAQLIELLRSMGAKIEGKGSTVSVIGADTLKSATFTPDYDHVDYFGFAVGAAMVRSNLLLKVSLPLSPALLHMNEFLEQMGIKTAIHPEGVMIHGADSSFIPVPTFPRADKNVYRMNPGPWPGFPADCLPSFIAWSTMNANPCTSTRSQNWQYTDGLKYIQPLKEMGAAIVYHDDQRVIVQGVQGGCPYDTTVPTTITSPDVIEGARAVIFCALSGGNYVIKNAQYILRRNPRFFEILKELGAEIEIENQKESVMEII